MRKIAALLLFTCCVDGSNLKVNDGPNISIEGVTIIDCFGVKPNYVDAQQCCLGNNCESIENPIFQRSNNQCPKIILDGFQYEVTSEIKIIHNVKLLSIEAGSLSGCRKPDNSFPTIGDFSQFNMTFNDSFLGIESMYLDVDSWFLFVNSMDGNLLCQGGVNVDLIFKNGFN